MTKKDYELIAEGIKVALFRPTFFQGKEVEALHDAYLKGVKVTAERVATLLYIDNPRFDNNKFIKACGIEE